MSKTHGIFVYEEKTPITIPRESSAGLQVVIGTAPVNVVGEPASVVNVPILANSATEAMAALGYSTDFKNYTLCQTMYVTSNLYQVSPVVYINVLDSAKHKKAMAAKEVEVSSLQATVQEIGVLKNGLTVKNGETELEENKDYVLAFDSDGYLVITLLAAGSAKDASSLTVSGNMLDPSAITKEDIIGKYDTATGAETGMEVIRKVYPKLGVVPGILIAPGWSQVPEVGIALSAKAANINGVFKAISIPDVDTKKAKKYTDVKGVKEESGFTSEFCYPVWPCFMVGEMILAGSAVAAARMAYLDAENEDVPSNSPSNKELAITGTCLADGTEVTLDQDQA